MGDFINEKVMPFIDKFTNSRIIYVWCLDKNFRIRMLASVPSNVTNSRYYLSVMFLRTAGTVGVLSAMMLFRILLLGAGTNAFELCKAAMNAVLSLISDGYLGYAVFVFFSSLF